MLYFATALAAGSFGFVLSALFAARRLDGRVPESDIDDLRRYYDARTTALSAQLDSLRNKAYVRHGRSFRRVVDVESSNG